MATKTLVQFGADGVNSFATISAWLASLPATLTQPEELDCGNFPYDCTAEIGIAINKTTSTANYLRIFTQLANRHNGKPRSVSGTGFRMIETGGFGALRISANHVRLDGLEIYETGTESAIQMVGPFAAGSDVRLDNSIVRDTRAGSSYTVFATAANLNLTCNNTIINGNQRTIDTRGSNSVTLNNCSGWRGADELGFVSGGEATYKNCYSGKSAGGSADWISAGVGNPLGNNNASSDATATSVFPSSSSINGVSGAAVFTSVTAGSEDWNLKAGANALVDVGATLVATATDAIGVARTAGSYDIGALERVAATAPLAPTVGVATPGNGQGTLTWTAPASNGGSPITGYLITASTGQTQAVGVVLSGTITLPNGVACTLHVAAINAIGTGPASAESNSITPMAPPTAAITSITFDGQDVTVSGTTTGTPSSGLGSIAADVTTPNGAITQGPTALTLGAGTFAVTFAASPTGNYSGETITVTNVGGTTSATGSSAFTIENVSGTPESGGLSVPDAPTGVVATAGNGTVSVTGSPPAFDGGASITGWRAVWSGGQVATSSSLPVVITGVTNGVAGTATLQAINSVGTGSTSDPSSSVTPHPVATISLVTPGGVSVGALSSLRWAWFDQSTPDLFVAPTDKGAIEVTDSSGILTLDLINSSKTSGQIGWLIVTNSDGATATLHKAFSGPVAVI